ncbi:MAG: hypothetical protein NZ585_00595 [Chloracidobacterium sp.]|nr:hypothetical protein [Chloracidobacterium sp.]MDW8216495.1 hypothetical protein [Acidobacteriota bacterium]
MADLLHRSGLYLAAVLSLLAAAVGDVVAGQRRNDAFNEQEIERIREAQEIDRRTEVFLKLATRRLNALEGRPDQLHKREEWGEPPSGTPRQLLDAYTRILDELADKLDAAAETKGEKDPKLRKALARLRHEMESHIVRLERLAVTDDELAVYRAALQTARMLLDGASHALSSSGLPAPQN